MHIKIPSVDCTSKVKHGKLRVTYLEEFPGTFPFYLNLHLIHKFHGTEFVMYISNSVGPFSKSEMEEISTNEYIFNYFIEKGKIKLRKHTYNFSETPF
jgi:hypothetical protein